MRRENDLNSRMYDSKCEAKPVIPCFGTIAMSRRAQFERADLQLLEAANKKFVERAMMKDLREEDAPQKKDGDGCPLR